MESKGVHALGRAVRRGQPTQEQRQRHQIAFEFQRGGLRPFKTPACLIRAACRRSPSGRLIGSRLCSTATCIALR